MSRAKINEEDLVLLVEDDGGQVGSQLGQFAGVQLAEEHGELRVVSSTFQMVEHLPATFVIGNIVADEEMPAGRHRMVTPV